MTPVVFEKCTLGGGSCKNTGPRPVIPPSTLPSVKINLNKFQLLICRIIYNNIYLYYTTNKD